LTTSGRNEAKTRSTSGWSRTSILKTRASGLRLDSLPVLKLSITATSCPALT
jgi:hypothetical protein